MISCKGPLPPEGGLLPLQPGVDIMPEFAVSEGKIRTLRERMLELGISEDDFTESFIRSSGPGGQHVNKSRTCVHLVHRPTGIELKCMQERSQSVNRFLARRELVERVAEKMGMASSRSVEQERIRRTKARNKRRSKSKGVGGGEQDVN
jgi:protein subunit release factor B